jgi:hypothetical protein
VQLADYSPQIAAYRRSLAGCPPPGLLATPGEWIFYPGSTKSRSAKAAGGDRLGDCVPALGLGFRSTWVVGIRRGSGRRRRLPDPRLVCLRLLALERFSWRGRQEERVLPWQIDLHQPHLQRRRLHHRRGRMADLLAGGWQVPCGEQDAGSGGKPFGEVRRHGTYGQGRGGFCL